MGRWLWEADVRDQGVLIRMFRSGEHVGKRALLVSGKYV